MQSVTGAMLTNVTVTGTSATQEGINLNTVNGLTMTNTKVTGVGDAVNECGVNAQNLGGTVTIDGGEYRDNFNTQIRVINSALATSALALTVKNVTSAGFIGMTALPATGGNGIQVIANGSANISSIAVQNNTIHHCWVEGILISQNSTSASLGTVTIGGSGQGNTFFDNGGHVNVATTASAVITSVNVTHNAMTQNPAALSTPANPILISAAGSTGGINNLTLQANTIGTTGVAKSGCNGCSGGIRLVSDGTGGAGNTPTISNMLIDGNTIRDTTGNGVQILIRNGSAKACGTITNNDIREADPSS